MKTTSTYDKVCMAEQIRYHDDADGASTTPDETDYYFYDTVDRLEKAVYSATKYGGLGATITSSLHDDAYTEFGDDTRNAGTFSDRIYYARRQTGTRDKVNWYRGAASGSSSALPSRNDTNTAPEQTTNYTTTDDPTADADNPTADGAGSRHNYTVIGQVGMQYDKKRNVIADATREFRYNYRSQLRRVIRKSDNSDISLYREDAYGRRVQAIMHWELGCRNYFDTRFDLTVDMDWDGDGTEMKYVDGGITSDDAPAPGAVDQIAGWPSRLDRTVTSNDTHYFDFHVDVPDAGGDALAYLGFVAYEQYEVRIYGNRYELWTTGGGSAIATYAAPGNDTKGRHNIGIKGGYASGIFIDGATAMGSGPTIITSPEARFGTHNIGAPDPVDGLVLLECLTYQKAFSLYDGDPTDPSVSLYFFDGPQVVTEKRIKRDPAITTTYMKVDAVNTTEQHRFDSSGDRTPEIYLPTGRRTTGQVIRSVTDPFVNADGDIVEHPGGEILPGVDGVLITDAVGATRYFEATGYYAIPNPDPYAEGSGIPEAGVWTQDMMVERFGTTYPPNPMHLTVVTSTPLPPSEAGERKVAGPNQPPAHGVHTCACTGDDKSTPNACATVCPATDLQHDNLDGVYVTPEPGFLLSPGGGAPVFPLPKDNTVQIELVGGIRVTFAKWVINGKTKYYREVGTNPHTGNKYFPHPNEPWDWDGCRINPADYEVPEEVVTRLAGVARGGLEVPLWLSDFIDTIGSLAGLNEEIGLVLLAYGYGGFGDDNEKSKEVIVQLIAGVTLGYAVGLAFSGFTAGASYVIAILGLKAFLRKVIGGAVRSLFTKGAKASAANNYLAKLFKDLFPRKSRGSLDPDVAKRLKEIEAGKVNPNVRKSKAFDNDGRAQINKDTGDEVQTALLPTHDECGNAISYVKHTVNPRAPGQKLDGKRIVVGSDGSIYVTDDHFETLYRVE